jgi:hypothetical protein
MIITANALFSIYLQYILKEAHIKIPNLSLALLIVLQVLRP